MLDPAPAELAVARAAGMETIAGVAEDLRTAGRSWDLVLVCQTIDHLLDLRGTMTALREALGPRGWAFVDILDAEIGLDRSGAIEEVLKIDHPYYLTRASATACFGLCGLSTVAERLTDDGHRGFLLVAGRPREPDWAALGRSAGSLLARIAAADGR